MKGLGNIIWNSDICTNNTILDKECYTIGDWIACLLICLLICSPMIILFVLALMEL